MEEDNTVIVSNLPDELKDIVEVYLESTKKGGGNIKNFEYNKTRQQAVVTFENSAGEFNWHTGFNLIISAYVCKILGFLPAFACLA